MNPWDALREIVALEYGGFSVFNPAPLRVAQGIARNALEAAPLVPEPGSESTEANRDQTGAPRREGWEAAKAGEPRVCPYRPGTRGDGAWLAGYDEYHHGAVETEWEGVAVTDPGPGLAPETEAGEGREWKCPACGEMVHVFAAGIQEPLRRPLERLKAPVQRDEARRALLSEMERRLAAEGERDRLRDVVEHWKELHRDANKAWHEACGDVEAARDQGAAMYNDMRADRDRLAGELEAAKAENEWWKVEFTKRGEQVDMMLNRATKAEGVLDRLTSDEAVGAVAHVIDTRPGAVPEPAIRTAELAIEAAIQAARGADG